MWVRGISSKLGETRDTLGGLEGVWDVRKRKGSWKSWKMRTNEGEGRVVKRSAMLAGQARRGGRSLNFMC